MNKIYLESVSQPTLAAIADLGVDALMKIGKYFNVMAIDSTGAVLSLTWDDEVLHVVEQFGADRESGQVMRQ